MVEMHLLEVGTNFAYSPVYALGVVTTYDRFMAGYKPESDRDSIFAALCNSASQTNHQQYRDDATALLNAAKELSSDTLNAVFSGEASNEGPTQVLGNAVKSHLDGTATKYTRLLGIGLFTLLETCDSELVQDSDKLAERLTVICEALKLPNDKLTKDLDLYRSNLEKLAMAQETMKDVLEAERKQREQRAKAREEKKAKAEATSSEAVTAGDTAPSETTTEPSADGE